MHTNQQKVNSSKQNVKIDKNKLNRTKTVWERIYFIELLSLILFARNMRMDQNQINERNVIFFLCKLIQCFFVHNIFAFY